MMLAAAAGQATPESARQDLADRGTLALISFRPERHEQLFDAVLGHGDLLFKDIGPPRRLQAPLLTEADRDAIFG